MSEVLHTVGNVRLVQDDEPGEFPDWGEGGFILLSHTTFGWIPSSFIESEDLPDPDKVGYAVRSLGFDTAEGTLQRWLRIYYNPKATVKSYTGYSQGDYWLVVSMEGDETTSDHIAAWAMGDVWRLTLEHRATYKLDDEPDDQLYRLDAPPTIEVWVRDPDIGATAYGEEDRLAIVAQFQEELEQIVA